MIALWKAEVTLALYVLTKVRPLPACVTVSVANVPPVPPLEAAANGRRSSPIACGFVDIRCLLLRPDLDGSMGESRGCGPRGAPGPPATHPGIESARR